MKQQSQPKQSNFCLNHNKPSIIEDEENMFCIDCIKMVIGNASLITTEQMTWKKQHFLVNALDFADKVHLLYMKLNEQFNKEIRTFIQVVEGFRQIINDAVHNASQMRQKAYLQCSEHTNYQEMETWYYKEQESYNGLNKKVEHQIITFQGRTQQLELFVKNISQNHKSFYNEEEQIQKERIIQFRNPQIQYNNEYEGLNTILEQSKIKQQVSTQLDQNIVNNSEILEGKMFLKFNYGIKDIIKDMQGINKQESIMKVRKFLNDKTIQVLEEKVMKDKEILKLLGELQAIWEIQNQQETYNSQNNQTNQNTTIINISQLDKTNIEQQIENVEIQSDDTSIEKYVAHQISNPAQDEIIEENIQQVSQSDQLVRQDKINVQKEAVINISQLIFVSGKQLTKYNSIKYRKFQYEKISDYTIKENTYCYSFAFNQNATTLFIGRDDNKIKVFEFLNGKIFKEVQTLSNHKNYVGCLLFMKKFNSLVSASVDRQIIIWNQDQNNQWQPQQILKGHTDWISCMIINEDEDLLISGSKDKTVKFWKKVDLSWSCQQTIDVSFSVRSLSLNASQTILISCGYNSNIKVTEHQPDQQWIITSTIKVDQWGYRLCFINDNQFVFQPFTNGFLEIYNYEQEKQQFIKAKQVQVQSCKDCYYYFPCQFIESKNILIVKHGKHVNFFGIDQNEDYVLQQSIEFGHEYDQYGRLTDDGQFLVTWDRGSKEISVRKFSYLE